MAELRELAKLLGDGRDAVLEEWMEELAEELPDRRIEPLRAEAAEILDLLVAHLGEAHDRWEETTDELSAIGRSRVAAGYATSETITLMSTLRQVVLRRAAALEDTDALRRLSRQLDAFLEVMVEAYVQARDVVIARQRDDLLELSTPTVQLWDGVVAVPLVGTLDSRRAIAVMESLLKKIAETKSPIAIIDITGVPTVDTLVAQHILRTAAAARLTGAHCILCGIRPQIAQTMIELGIELGGVETRADLAAAFAAALEHRGLRVESAANG